MSTALKEQMMQYIRGSARRSSLSDLVRLDRMQLALVKKGAAINPSEYDYTPWLYQMVTFLSYYAREVKGIKESDEFKTVREGNAQWIIYLVTGRTTETKQQTWERLLRYIESRGALLDLIKQTNKD